jgi:uncharacterized membrane protein YphA (DoxX/SURF4 family)
MKMALLLVIRFGLGIVLLYTGISKIRHPYDFLSAVYSYRLVGPSIGLIIAAVFPWLEVVSGGCLICGVMLSGASFMSLCLGIVITMATTSALLRGLKITCGCFGGAGSTIDSGVVLRSSALLVAAIALLFLAQTGLRQRRPQ